jgi:CheY-like chemotaxis protein
MLPEGCKMPKDINLLIVDDDVSLRNSLSMIFTALGHTVRSAQDGFSALLEIRQTVPTIVLSDLNMPGMSGFELLSIVRRRFPAIRVIAMSGAMSGEHLQLGVAADAFHEKGTGIASLIQTVQRMSSADHLPSPRNSGRLAPQWIARNGNDTAGEPFVNIPCPECLRSFPQVLADTDPLIRETSCRHCSHVIHYAILQPTDPAFPQAFQQKPEFAA